MKHRLISSLALASLLLACETRELSEPEKGQLEASSSFQGQIDIWPEIHSEVQLNQEVEDAIEKIVSKMSLEHKVAQMIQGEIRHVTPEDVKKYRLGSVLNGGGSYPSQERYSSIDDWLNLADAYWEASVAEPLDYPVIPLMWGTDAVHGHNNVIGSVLFPHNVGLGAANDPQLMREIGKATAKQVIATGIDWTFAPTVAVSMDLRWGRSYESYGQTPQLVHDYAYEMVKGIQGADDKYLFNEDHIVATVKHFVGDGGTLNGIDQGNTYVDEKTLFDTHAQGYVGGLKAGAQTVMASFNTWNGDKLHGHRYMLTEVLKEKMGFDGFVVGDWNGHGQVPGCGNDHCAAAINAGVDMIMVPEHWEAFLHNTIADVKAGVISEARIDDAVTRILRVKMRSGLMDAVKPSDRVFAGDTSVLWGEGVKALARDAVRKSLVLLKNEDQTLPLKDGQKILITGPAVNDISKQVGGWSITWQGTQTGPKDFPNATLISHALKDQAEAKGIQAVISQDHTQTDNVDLAVVIFGEPAYAEFNGDRPHLMFSELDAEPLRVLKDLKAKGIKVVSVFLSGRPMWVNPELNNSDAFVAAWLPGSEGQGVADVLLGDYDFVGRLPGRWPLESKEVSAQNLAIGSGASYLSQAPINAELDEAKTKIQLDESLVLLKGVVAEGMSIETDQATSLVADFNVQEDARNLVFGNQGGRFAITFDEVTNQNDFRRMDARIKFALKLNGQLPEAVKLSLRSQVGEGSMDITDLVNASKQWQEWSVPLYCIVPDISALSSTISPFTISSSEHLDISIADISWEFSDETDYDCPNYWEGEADRPKAFITNR